MAALEELLQTGIEFDVIFQIYNTVTLITRIADTAIPWDAQAQRRVRPRKSGVP